MPYKKSNNNNAETLHLIVKVVWLLVLLLLVLSLIRSCQVCSERAAYRVIVRDKTGYLPENEDWDNIPDIKPPYDDDTLNLQESVSLEKYFPPIGDQGNKGTCVAWAVGYNLKTALNAIQNQWDSTMLRQPVNQTSPKDLFLSIPKALKGSGCSGSTFEPAFNVLTTKGVASMEVVPYQNLQGCSGIGVGDTLNRIAGFYRVTSDGDIPKLGELKAYLNDTIPLVIGARLGDQFMNWHNDEVIKQDTYNYTGMHAYHAIALVGYDDNRQAFRLRNSWGTSWGDEGSIWVDYAFFSREFCYVVFMAENENNNQ